MTKITTVKQEILSDLEKRVNDKILEQNNFNLLKKLIENASSSDEAIRIAELGTTYKRTGFHFDKQLEKQSNTISYFKKNNTFSFVTDSKSITHKLIVGDNYPALLNLLVEYKSKVDVIYIDPPYGKDSMGEFAHTNYENAITRDTLLSMLYPRLWVAKQLLSDKGVIVCSVDDRNQAYLKCLFDEVFEEINFISCFPRITKKGGKSAEAVAKNHDYILIYSKTSDVEFNLEEHTDDGFSNKDEFFEERGLYKLNQTLDYDTLGYVPTLDYPIVIDNKTYYAGGSYDDYKKRQAKRPKNGARWRWSKELLDFGVKNGFVVVKTSKNGERIYTKTYQNAKIKSNSGKYEIVKIDRTKKLSTLNFIENGYSNDNAKKDIDNVLDKGVFDYSKPLMLIKDICSFFSSEDSIILDFFAGSGTTGQAVLELNEKDNGSRQFILVTTNEITDTTPNGIVSDVTSKRLKRVMTGKCYDSTSNFEWAKKNKPLGDNLEVLDIAEVANFESVALKTAFDVIDETLYGNKKFTTVREKVEWVCNNFEVTQKRLEE